MPAARAVEMQAAGRIRAGVGRGRFQADGNERQRRDVRHGSGMLPSLASQATAKGFEVQSMPGAIAHLRLPA